MINYQINVKELVPAFQFLVTDNERNGLAICYLLIELVIILSVVGEYMKYMSNDLLKLRNTFVLRIWTGSCLNAFYIIMYTYVTLLSSILNQFIGKIHTKIDKDFELFLIVLFNQDFKIFKFYIR